MMESDHTYQEGDLSFLNDVQDAFHFFQILTPFFRALGAGPGHAPDLLL